MESVGRVRRAGVCPLVGALQFLADNLITLELFKLFFGIFILILENVQQ